MADRNGQATELAEFVQTNGTKVFRVGGVDLDGQWRSKRVPAQAILDGKPLSYTDFVFGVDIHDALYTPNLEFTGWKTGWPDIRMIPDPSTARRLPWEKDAATLICDYTQWSGEEIDLSPRTVLSRVTDRVRSAGFEPKVAVELEFFVLRETSDSLAVKNHSNLEFLTRGNHSYHPFQAADYIGPWIEQLQEYGIPVEGANTEWGSGQFEINIKYGSPLEAADNTLMYKHALKELAARQGLTVSFMARIAADQPGSSGHLHQSLWDAAGKQNLFWDNDAPHKMSLLMAQYAAGLLFSLRDFAVIYLPFVNSYRRVLDYLSSPTTVTWGVENRTTSVRALPHVSSGCRLEHRIPGADCNPYLMIAAALSGGLYGIEHELRPPDLVRDDAYAADAPHLPRSLEEALDLFEKSDLPKEVFGEEFVRHYSGTRRWEIEQYRQTVTDWERQRYLEVV